MIAKSVDRPAGGNPQKAPDAERAGRFRLASVAARLMFDPARKEAGQKQERVCTCHRWRTVGTVQVRVDHARNKAIFGGLESCSNVWACPICSGTITEERRHELQASIEAWAKQGGSVYLLTLTLPHVRADNLSGLLKVAAATSQRFKQSKAWRSVMDQAGAIGTIRALECTWGSWHGWHPHFHILIFAKPDQLPAFEQLRAAWVSALLKTGAAGADQLNDITAHSFDVRGGDFAAEYVAKFGHEPSFKSKLEAQAMWGASREMVKGQSKVSHSMRGSTPFTLLVAAEKGDNQAAALFREFYWAFKGRRQLTWSPKLRARLGLDAEADDDEILERQANAPEFETVATLTRDDWGLVLRHRARYQVLLWAEREGAAGVQGVLLALRQMEQERPPDKGPPDEYQGTSEGFAIERGADDDQSVNAFDGAA